MCRNANVFMEIEVLQLYLYWIKQMGYNMS